MKADSSDVLAIQTALEYQLHVSHFSGHQTTATGFVVFALSHNIRSSFCATNFISCITVQWDIIIYATNMHSCLVPCEGTDMARFVGGIADLFG